ncbi:hypothetical protein BH11PLA1_BH11PLA1_06960 [soil metagenome]
MKSAAKPKPSKRAVIDPEIGFALPATTAAQRARAADLYAALVAAYPDAHCELDFGKPHELLAATILSAQATDVSVNRATPALFARFKTPADFAAASPAEIEPFIKTIGLYRTKAKALHGAMSALVNDFAGAVPRTMPELLTLRGVARKTAGVVLGNCFGVNVGVVVDTHVHRLSHRFALVPPATNVQNTERTLMALFPRDKWNMLSHLLIFHGRRCCSARLPARGPGQPACPPRCDEGRGGICAQFGTRCELRIIAKAAQPTRERGSTKSTGRANTVRAKAPKAKAAGANVRAAAPERGRAQ